MADKAKSLDDLFGEEESVLARRHRERLAREEAYNKTPEGIAEHEAFLERLRKREEARANEPEEEPEEDNDEDEDGEL